MIDKCLSCHSTDRQRDPYQLGGVEMSNDYCGACGATWGHKAKVYPRLTDTSPTHRRVEGQTVATAVGASSFGRVSDGSSLNQRLKQYGIKGVRKAKPYAPSNEREITR